MALEFLSCSPPSLYGEGFEGTGTEMVAFLESVLSGLDCLDCLAEKGENPKVSGRAVSTSVDVLRPAPGIVSSQRTYGGLASNGPGNSSGFVL